MNSPKETTTNETKKHGERSSPYPSTNLETAIQDAEDLRCKLGKGPYSREEAAKALGYKGVNGISASRIASCGYFGLLSRSGSSYNMSELAEKILDPTSEAERQEAIITACKTPTLYDRLLQAYDGQALPQMLPNILSRNHGISSKASEAAARVFRESAEFAGCFRNGIISAQPEISSENNSTVSEQEATMRNEVTKSTADPDNSETSGSFKRERGVSEAGEDWELQVSCKYNIALPRELRKKINEFLGMADDIIDGFSDLGDKDEGDVEHE